MISLIRFTEATVMPKETAEYLDLTYKEGKFALRDNKVCLLGNYDKIVGVL